MKLLASLLLLAATAAYATDFRPFAVSEISSMQLRQDGTYNVVCKNGTFENVTAADVAANNVCPYVKPSGILLEGMYKASHSSYCDQAAHATYTRQQLESIRLEYPGCAGEFLAATCEGLKCSGVSAGQNIEVTILDPEHYEWNNTSINEIVNFTRIGDLPTQKELAEMQKRKKSKSKIAGQ